MCPPILALNISPYPSGRTHRVQSRTHTLSEVRTDRNNAAQHTAEIDISDDGSLIWLTDPSLTSSVVETLSEPSNQQALGIQEIFALQSLRDKFNDPRKDPRTPNIVLKVNTGVIFTGGSKIAEHGGLNEDDVHVALLISFPSIKKDIVKTPVTNQQVAPTIIKALGFDPSQLRAVQQEQIQVLPFFFTDADED